MTEKKKIAVVEVTVKESNQRSPLRLTALGSIPLDKGAVFLAQVDLGLALVAQHPDHLEIVGKQPHHTPTKEVDALKYGNGTWEPLKGIKAPETEEKKPVDTSKAAPTQAGKAGNKSMAGREEKSDK